MIEEGLQPIGNDAVEGIKQVVEIMIVMFEQENLQIVFFHFQEYLFDILRAFHGNGSIIITVANTDEQPHSVSTGSKEKTDFPWLLSEGGVSSEGGWSSEAAWISSR